MDDDGVLHVAAEGGVATLTLDSPADRNAPRRLLRRGRERLDFDELLEHEHAAPSVAG